MKIIKGNIVHAATPEKVSVLEGGCIVLRDDGTIDALLDKAPESYSAEVIDYGDKLVMQSFADMHLHAPQYPMLGMGMDLPLIDWLGTYTFPVEARFADVGFAREVYRKLADELIRGGTTRVSIFSSLHTDATLVLMEELERAGVTGFVGKVNMDRNGGEKLCETTEESKRETLRWLEACEDFKTLKPILTPRFTPSCTDALMAWLGGLAEQRGLYVQSHLSENKSEVEWVRALHPDCEQYWQTYEKFGLWKSHTLMAHCVYSGRREREAMAKANVGVVHCADSNMNLCSGTAPVREMLREGLWVMLGSDIAGGAELEMNKVVTKSIRASKLRHIASGGSENFLTVDEAYYLGTSSGHRYFGDKDGFAVGNKLHAIVVDDASFPPAARDLTVHERFERAVYLMERAHICAVWSEGKKVIG